MPRFKNSLTKLLEKNCLDKNILAKSAWQTFETKNFQVYQNYNVVFFNSKSERV